MDNPRANEWSTERGYSIPPPADGRNIVNQPMKFGAVKVGQNTFPGSTTPQTPTKFTDKSEVKEKDSALESVPKPIFTEQSSIPPISRSSGLTGTKSVQIEWQGCKFNVAFDDVWVQTDPSDPKTIKWLILVHDLNRNPEGPTWTPPVSTTSSTPTTLTIYHDSNKYACAYFGLELLVPICNLSLTIFLVTK